MQRNYRIAGATYWSIALATSRLLMCIHNASIIHTAPFTATIISDYQQVKASRIGGPTTAALNMTRPSVAYRMEVRVRSMPGSRVQRGNNTTIFISHFHW